MHPSILTAMQRRFGVLILSLLAFSGPVTADKSLATDASVRLAFYEAGPYFTNSILRQAIRDQIDALAPNPKRFVIDAESYYSAEWDRQTSQRIATTISNRTEDPIDIVVTLGPWGVEDLLAAGYSGAIVAVDRIGPIAEGLADNRGQPIASNLTLTARPEKISIDLSSIASLTDKKRIGVVAFPSGENRENLASAIERLGWTVWIGEGTDNRGTYAPIVAIESILDSVDVIYAPNLWGMRLEAVRDIARRLAEAGMLFFVGDGRFAVERGALASATRQTIFGSAATVAWKIGRIADGIVPADLPTMFRDHYGWTINAETQFRLGLAIPTAILSEAEVIGTPAPTADIETLTDLVQAAEATSGDVLAARERVAAARAITDAISAGRRPQLTGFGSVGYIDDNAVDNSGGRFENSRWDLGVRLAQLLYAPEITRAIARAESGRDRQAAAEERLRVTLRQAIAAAYQAIFVARERAVIATGHRLVIERQFAAANGRYRVARDNPVQLLFWRQQFDRALIAAAQARQTALDAEFVLKALVGRPPDYPLALDPTPYAAIGVAGALGQLSVVAPTDSAANAVATWLAQQAVDRSPDVIESDFYRDSLAFAAQTARRWWRPKIGLQAEFALTDSLAERPGFDPQLPTWWVGATVELPLWLGGSRSRRAKAIGLQQSAVEFERDALRARVAGEVSVAFNAIVARLNALPRYNRQLQASVTMIEEGVLEYERGTLTLADLVAILESARAVRLEELALRDEIHAAANDLTYYLAADWATEVAATPLTEIVDQLRAWRSNR